MRNATLLIVLACNLLSTACTTLTPTEASPEEVRQLLLSGDLLKPGDRVRLVTSDEEVHKFRVTEIDREQGIVFGNNKEVPVVDVVAVETREASVGRTALLVGGIGYGVVALIAIAVAPAVLLGGG